MPRFKLLVGKHTQKEQRGEARVPVTYKKGDVFDSEHDLVAMFNHPGSQKFEQVDGGPPLKKSSGVVPAGTAQNAAPGGQVSSGFQQTTSGPDGEPVSGPVSPQEAQERYAEQKKREAEQPKDPKAAEAPKASLPGGGGRK